MTLVDTWVLAASASLASPKSATCVKTRVNYLAFRGFVFLMKNIYFIIMGQKPKRKKRGYAYLCLKSIIQKYVCGLNISVNNLLAA